MRTPTIGQMVHYNCRENEVRMNQKVAAGIIVAVHSADCVNLRVLLDQPSGAVDPWVTSTTLAKEPGEVGSWEWLPAYTPPIKGG